MPQTFNNEVNTLANLDFYPLSEKKRLGAGAGGVVFSFRYQGGVDPEFDALVRPFIYRHTASDGQVFEYLGVKMAEGGLPVSDQEASNAAYLAKPYLDAAKAKRPIQQPEFNLCGPALMSVNVNNIPVRVLMTKIEVGDVEEVLDRSGKVVSLKFTGGSLDNFLDEGLANLGPGRATTPRKMGLKSALTNDLAITIGQFFGSVSDSHYQLILRKLIQADMALRNALLSGVDSPALKHVPYQKRIPTKFAVRINDLGLSEIAENVDEGVVVDSDIMPLVYSDQDRLLGRQVTKTSDLFAKRIMFFEFLARLEHNPGLFDKMVSPDGGPRTHVQVAVFVATYGNENALQQYIRNSKTLIKSEESAIFLSSFQRYLVPESKTLREMTVEEDIALQEQCFNDYFEKLLAHKLKSLNTENPTHEAMQAFLVSLHRLLELKVSDTYKEKPVYRKIQALANKFPLTDDYLNEPTYVNALMSTFVKDCSELKIFLLSNQHELLIKNVKSSINDYETQVLQAHSLMDEDLENLQASDFEQLNQVIDHWQGHPDEKTDLQKKIEQLTQEIEQLNKLLVEEAEKMVSQALRSRDGQLYMRQLEIINNELGEAKRNLAALQEKSNTDSGLWKDLVEKRKVVFQMEQERILNEIAVNKAQYEQAIQNLSAEEPNNISVIEVGKTLAILLAIEKSAYEYQRLGKYVSETAPDIEALFNVPLLNNLREIPSYKPLLAAFDMERRRNAPKDQQSARPVETQQVHTESSQTNAHQGQQPNANHSIEQSEQVATTPIANTVENQNTHYGPVRIPEEQNSSTPTVAMGETENTPYGPVRIPVEQDSTMPATNSRDQQNSPYAPIGSQTETGEPTTSTVHVDEAQSNHYGPVVVPPNQASMVTSDNAPLDTPYAPLEANQSSYVPQKTIADAAAEYVAAMNHLVSIGVGSLEALNMELKFADFAIESDNLTLMSIAFMNLGETSLILRAMKEAREAYLKVAGKNTADATDVLAAAALKGVHADPEKINEVINISDSTQRLNNTIGKLITQSGEASKMKEQNKRKVTMPTTVTSVKAEGFKEALETIYKKEIAFIAQIRYLHNYFFDNQGHLKNNTQLGMELTPQERYTLEHLLSPYKKIFAELPQGLTKPALDTVEERNDATMEIISWRVKKPAYFDQVRLSAENSPALLDLMNKLPDKVKPALQTAVTAPEAHAQSMSEEVTTLFQHVKDSTTGAHSKLKALLIYLQNKNQKAVDGIQTSAKNKTTRSTEDTFKHHKEDIKAQQREKIKNLKVSCQQQIDTKFADKAMASQVNNVLELLAAYGIKQRTDQAGLLKVRKVQELLTGILEQNSREGILKYIDKKLKTDTDLYQHKAHSGDTQFVRLLHGLERALGKQDVPQDRSKRMAFGGSNLLKSQQKADAEIRKMVGELVKTTKKLSEKLAAGRPEGERKRRATTVGHDSRLFNQKKSKKEPVSLPEITPPTPGNLH